MNGKAQEAPGSPPPIVLHPEVGLLNKIMVRAYMIFVADVVDIVRRANIFMWSNFAPHENLSVLCGGNLLSMKSNFAPYASKHEQGQGWPSVQPMMTVALKVGTEEHFCKCSQSLDWLCPLLTEVSLEEANNWQTSKPNLSKCNQPSRRLGSLLGSTSSWTTDEISLGSSIKAPTLSPALGTVPSY